MLNRNLIAVDLAKDVFQVCRVSKTGKTQSNKAISRNKLKELLANSTASVVAFEACGSAHYWGRLAERSGHQVRMIAPKKVKPFRQGHKTDKTDAQAIAIAAQHDEIKSCPVKTVEQQTVQSFDTSRQFIIKQIRALENHIRAMVYEYGLTIPRGKKQLHQGLAMILEDADNGFPHALRATLSLLQEQLRTQDERLKSIEKEKASLVNTIEPCQRLTDLEGVGPVVASMLYAILGDGNAFKNGRAASAYLGATPKQHSSGGKTVIVGIDKKNMHKNLISTMYQGALSVICRLPSEPETVKQQWLIRLVQRAGTKAACIALVNKTIRTAWALLSSGEKYKVQLIAA